MTFDDPHLKQDPVPDENGYTEWLASLADMEAERHACEHPAPGQEPSGDGRGRASLTLPPVMRWPRKPTLSLKPNTSDNYRFRTGLADTLRRWERGRER